VKQSGDEGVSTLKLERFSALATSPMLSAGACCGGRAKSRSRLRLAATRMPRTHGENGSDKRGQKEQTARRWLSRRGGLLTKQCDAAGSAKYVATWPARRRSSAASAANPALAYGGRRWRYAVLGNSINAEKKALRGKNIAA